MFDRVLDTRVDGASSPRSATSSKCLNAKFFYNIYMISVVFLFISQCTMKKKMLLNLLKANVSIRNQSIDMQRKSFAWFLCDGNIDLKCVESVAINFYRTLRQCSCLHVLTSQSYQKLNQIFVLNFCKNDSLMLSGGKEKQHRAVMG